MSYDTANKQKQNKISTCKKVVRIIIAAAVCICIPITVKIHAEHQLPESYIITAENQFDYQMRYECSGYASAYAIRALGVQASGLELYNRIPGKERDGTVPIPVLVPFLQSEHYKVSLNQGSLTQLKQTVCKGYPVIAFVRVAPNSGYYHYFCVVGYDSEHIYVVDSLRTQTNAESPYYNRILSTADFQNMWATGIAPENLYITIELPS